MDTRKLWKQFIRRVSAIIILFGLGMVVGLFVKNIELLNREIETRAKSHFHNIVLTRRWNANYHGVYVKKEPGVTSSPYLSKPDITAADGTVYTLKNPALMTREISELAEHDSLFSFHITSLDPLNPNNQPDAFETTALTAFEGGAPFAEEKIKTGGRTLFRYMEPLFVEESCLECHAAQGYRLGEVRGGISITMDITEIQRSLALNNIAITSLGAAAVILLLFLTYVFIRQLMVNIEKKQKIIQDLAVTDELTQLFNRRFYFDKLNQEIARSRRHSREIACLMMDIDHFKNFNDTYGHQVGDLVLKEVATLIKAKVRETDTVARYGGEEFSVLLPETGTDGAAIFAEKIRKAVADKQVTTPEGEVLSVTISLGVCAMGPDDLNAMQANDEIMKYADEALYQAKENGRNQVCIHG